MSTDEFEKFYLSKWIKNAVWNWDFNSMMVVGSRGVGKSTYAMLLAYHYFGDWDEVFDALYFDAENLFKDIEEKNRMEIVIIDDAGVGFNTNWFFSDKKYYQLLDSLAQVLRSDVANLFLTTPTIGRLVKPFRTMNDFLIKIGYTTVGKRRRRASVFRTLAGGDSKTMRDLRQRETFTCRLPQEAYKRYKKIRRAFRNMVLPKLKDMVKKGKDEMGYNAWRPDRD